MFFFLREPSHLSICEPQHGSQLLSVRLGDVLLYLESLLQTFPLQVGEHGPRPRPLPLVRLRHRVFREDGVGTCRRQKHTRGTRVESTAMRRHTAWLEAVSCSPTGGVYLGRCPETDAGLRVCCCCLVNSSWRTRPSQGLWRRSTGWQEAERGRGGLTDGWS